MNRYRITGGSFRMPDGSVKTAGDEIELASDVAATHAGQLTPLDEAPQPQAPADAEAQRKE